MINFRMKAPDDIRRLQPTNALGSCIWAQMDLRTQIPKAQASVGSQNADDSAVNLTDFEIFLCSHPGHKLFTA